MTFTSRNTCSTDRVCGPLCHIVVRIFRQTVCLGARLRFAKRLRSKRVQPGARDETEMKNISKARLIFTDFAASLAMAISIGLVTSITLGGAVLLIAEHSASNAQPASSHPAQGNS